MSTLQFRRSTAAQAAANNPVLAAGEPGFTTDTGVLKVGDGVTAWNSLGVFPLALILSTLTSLRGAAAASDILKVGVTGDASDRFILNADGSIEHGDGTSAPVPTVFLGGGSTQNLALGRSALNRATTGTRLTAIGRNAMAVNTTGASNTAVGASTLAANTTGFSDTAVGSEALLSNVDGNSNTAVGKSSMRLNTSGYLNTAAGVSALGANTVGFQNVAIGASALSTQTVTFNNTAVGNSAGALLDPFQVPGVNGYSGADNTILGLSAMANSVHATYDVAIGIEAGRQLSSLGRMVTDGQTTSGSPTFTSATAAFTNDTAADAGDVGRSISATGIPAGTTILAVLSATQVTMSANATANGSGLTTYIACELDAGGVPRGSFNIAIGRYALDKALGIPANGTTTGMHNIGIGMQTGFMSRTQRDYTIQVGTGAGTDGDHALALAHNARAGAAGAVAIGCDSAGTGASTTVANEIKLGTALHTVTLGGDLPLKFNSASAAQTTVGAAGGASALPATPTKYFKVKDSAGTTLIIPAYAAA